MARIEENTVSAENQMKNSAETSYLGSSNAKTRILVLGNSITRHAPCEEIGWHGDWGMAASCEANDFVHRLYEKCADKDVLMMIRQASYWERHFADSDILTNFQAEKEFGADILIFRLGENVGRDVDEKLFFEKLKEFLNFLSKPTTKLLLTNCFWKHPIVDTCIHKYVEEYNATLVDLNRLGEQDEMMALDKFEHKGVAMHPGDKGMEAIATAIFEKI
jgi:hypothetical protein